VSQDVPQASSMVDMVFPLAGHSLPRDHAQVLRQSLQHALPWLSGEAQAGIHAVKLVPGGESLSLLSQRTRLLLRLPIERVNDAQALAGRTITVGACTMRLGIPHLRELLPHTTLYAPAVAAPGADEAVFMQAVAGELETLAVRTQTVCGKRQSRHLQGQTVTTFSLMLHALSQPDSLRLQERGLGPHRLLGCGIFVPHRSAAAVGS
jgi:CRISPR-associated protein Cas6